MIPASSRVERVGIGVFIRCRDPDGGQSLCVQFVSQEADDGGLGSHIKVTAFLCPRSGPPACDRFIERFDGIEADIPVIPGVAGNRGQVDGMLAVVPGLEVVTGPGVCPGWVVVVTHPPDRRVGKKLEEIGPPGFGGLQGRPLPVVPGPVPTGGARIGTEPIQPIRRYLFKQRDVG